MGSPAQFINERLFWRKVDTGDPAECWIWKNARFKSGYGLVTYLNPDPNGALQLNARAHRVSYEFTHGEISEKICVLHTCDNRACCNPSHLYLGDRKQNARDRILRSKSSGGLYLTDVKKIRSLLQERRPIKSISKSFGVSGSCISHIKAGRTWDLNAESDVA